jgi:general secretion pathway protein G
MGDLQRQPTRLLATGVRRRRRRLLGDQSGLTLIELLVVMVILGLFSTIVYQAFFPKIDQAKNQTVRTQMDILALALDSYRLDVGEYPAALADLVQSSSPRWKGPYLQKGKVPKDAWGNEFVYQVKDEGGAFDLASTGDGKKEIRYGEEE